MAKVKVYNLEGKESGELELDPKVFDVEVNDTLVHEVMVAQMANSRQVLAHAKDRSEVRGGGRKPWRQKGTGRARAGSSRSPIWRGGGATFGPSKIANFSKKVNKKVRKQAVKMILSDKARDDMLLVLESFDITEAKTKLVADLIKKLSVSKKVLVVTDKEDGKLIRASKNIINIETIGSNSLNVVDLLKKGNVIFSKKTIAEVTKSLKE